MDDAYTLWDHRNSLQSVVSQEEVGQFCEFLESIGFDSLGPEQVVVGIEDGEFGWQHGQFDQLVLCQRQLLQHTELRERSILDLRDQVPCQVDPPQSHNVNKVFGGDLLDPVVASVQVGCLFWKCGHSLHFWTHFLTVNGARQTHAQQACWKIRGVSSIWDRAVVWFISLR